MLVVFIIAQMPCWLCAGRGMRRVTAAIIYAATATTAATVPVVEVNVIAAVAATAIIAATTAVAEIAAIAAIADIVEGPNFGVATATSLHLGRATAAPAHVDGSARVDFWKYMRR